MAAYREGQRAEKAMQGRTTSGNEKRKGKPNAGKQAEKHMGMKKGRRKNRLPG